MRRLVHGAGLDGRVEVESAGRRLARRRRQGRGGRSRRLALHQVRTRLFHAVAFGGGCSGRAGRAVAGCL